MKKFLFIALFLSVMFGQQRATTDEEEIVILNEDGSWQYQTGETGKKKDEGIAKDEKENGTWITMYENGQKNSEGTYRGGKKDGQWTEWYMTGEKKSEGNYTDGKKDGKWTEWNKDWQKSEGTYMDGKKMGNGLIGSCTTMD